MGNSSISGTLMAIAVQTEDGKYLVIAHGTADDVARARQVLQGTGPTELNVHGQAA